MSQDPLHLPNMPSTFAIYEDVPNVHSETASRIAGVENMSVDVTQHTWLQSEILQRESPVVSGKMDIFIFIFWRFNLFRFNGCSVMYTDLMLFEEIYY